MSKSNYSAVPFPVFAQLVRDKFAQMCSSGNPIIEVAIAPYDLAAHYLQSFPEGTNELFRERNEYDCNCCLAFIRRIGNLVEVTPTGLVSIWDVTVGGYYQPVTDALSAAVKAAQLVRPFLTTETTAGGQPNKDNYTDIVWSHFYAPIQPQFVKDEDLIGPTQSEIAGSATVLAKGLDDFTEFQLSSTLDLAETGSIYRGEEFSPRISEFLTFFNSYHSAPTAEAKMHLFWSQITDIGVSRFANSVVGTLVADLCEGVSLERAVASYEAKVAPTNYRRTTAVVSPRQIEALRKELETLGMLDSLERRVATEADVPATELMFAKQPATHSDPFAAAIQSPQVRSATYDKARKPDVEMSMPDFSRLVTQEAQEVELLFEQLLTPRLVSLVTASVPEAPLIFGWDNSLSWAYIGDTTDAIKERVKRAGGDVEGDVVVSLAWGCGDDLDLHMRHGSQTFHYNSIYFGNREAFGGRLDVDMNTGSHMNSVDPVENIAFKDSALMPQGNLHIYVNNYTRRSSGTNEFTVRVAIEGQVFTLVHDRVLREGASVHVATLRKDGRTITMVPVVLPLTSGVAVGAEVWGNQTGTFVPVKSVMHSPNHWGDKGIGNKHTFFMLEDCVNPEPVRGFYSEYLSPKLVAHRKAFEVLGTVTKTEVGPANQLSGIGFSSTDTFEFYVRVKTASRKSQIIKVTN